MALTRIFHPIGQGAFYTERHSFKGIEFTLVYDCGSTTLTKSELEKKIKSTFPKNYVIDVLFISHFHADHINGIEILANHCKIRKVIMPLIDDESKVLLKVTNLINSDFADTSLIDNPEDFFGGNVPIVRIEYSQIGSETEDINVDNPNDISEIGTSIEKPSGSVFKLTSDEDWILIPFNYKHEDRKKVFQKALEDSGIVLADIDTLNKIQKNKKKIIKAYNDVQGDLNTNTLILFSGKQSEDNIQCFDHFHHYFFHRHFCPSIQSGCLYLGDIDLNQSNIVKDISSKSKLGKFLPYIGTLQVPHHGSIYSFARSILKPEFCCAIFSYGTTNTYGHPSDSIIGEIVGCNIYPHFVTEQQTSIVVQWK